MVGAGIGGLMSALALQRHGLHATLYERDSAPPQGVSAQDSIAWLRKGVPQSLHPHFFMGRLRILMEEHYPDIVESLFRAGVGESSASDYVHPDFTHRVRPRATDSRLRTLNCRRTTFEMIVRQHVETLPGIALRNDARATGLLTEEADNGSLLVRGITLEGDNGKQEAEADAVIDASGRFSKLARSLTESGIDMHEDQRDSGIWYFTRHYRIKPGATFPQVFGLPGAQFDDFVVGALPADNGAFTVTFQVFQDDKPLAQALRDPEHFQRVCEATNQVAPWVNPQRAVPTSDVYGFGQMDSYWRTTVIDGKSSVLNFFCVGDSAVRSNPKYGRGCTWTSLAAHKAAEVLAGGSSPDERIREYESWLEAEFRHDWLTMRTIDRSMERAFAVAMGKRKPGALEKVTQRVQAFTNDAMITEPALFRDLWTGYNGLQNMSTWARHPLNWLRMLRAWIGRSRYQDVHLSQRGRMSHDAMSREESLDESPED